MDGNDVNDDNDNDNDGDGDGDDGNDDDDTTRDKPNQSLSQQGRNQFLFSGLWEWPATFRSLAEIPS